MMWNYEFYHEIDLEYTAQYGLSESKDLIGGPYLKIWLDAW